MRPLYDTKEGIATYLTSLEAINLLAKERREAYHERGERLGNFYVMGRWSLDTCANFSPLEASHGAQIPAELGTCPPVMTAEEMNLFMRGGSICSVSRRPFPPVYARCTECGEGWTFANCHEFQNRSGYDEGSLEDFVGKPLANIDQIPSLVGKVWHCVDHDTVYSDVYQGETRSGSEGKPWYRVEKDHIIQPGDRAMLQTMLFSHKECNLKRIQQCSRQEMTTIFSKAGFPQAQLISIPNQYCPCDVCPPWYTVQVDDLEPITIGWRKRVINIDWSRTKRNLVHLFEGEDVTKEAHLIHAYGDEKAAEYLTKILSALGAIPKAS